MKQNKTFMILSVFGILFVVSSHYGAGINFFNDIFSYGSFYMPLFIFISGYFYKKENEERVCEYIRKKLNKLIIPFLIWNLVYGIFVNFLKSKNIIIYGQDISLKTLFITPFIKNEQFQMNLAAWFIPALFFVNIVYILIRKILTKAKLWNDWIMFDIFLAIGIIAVYYQDIAVFNDYRVILLRTAFFMPFYHIGYLYKDKIERINDKVPNSILLCTCIIINLILIKNFKILDYNVHNFSGFNERYLLLPFITSITGILFWLRISKILEKALGNSKIINYISDNTYSIMMHHAFFGFLINSILYKLKDICKFTTFNKEKFKAAPFYSYTMDMTQFNIIFVMIGIIGPVLLKYIYDRWEKKIIKKIEKNLKEKIINKEKITALAKKFNYSTKIFIIFTMILVIFVMFSKLNVVISKITFYVFGIWSLYFLFWLIYNIGRIAKLKYNSKEIIIMSMFGIVTIGIYFYIILSRKIIYQWDALTYYIGNLKLLNVFNTSFIAGIKEIIKTTYQNDYGYFLLIFTSLPFSLTNKTENAFILCYSITIVLPTIIIFSMIMKKLIEKFEFKHKYKIQIIGNCLLVLFPLLHAATIAGQPDIIGLIFVGCIILLTIDYDFIEKDMPRWIFLIISSICLIISRRWYMFWALGYAVSYLICIFTKAIIERRYQDLKKMFGNLIIFGLILLSTILITLFPMIKRILKQDFSSYTSWNIGGFSKEIELQISRLGWLYVIIMLIGLFYGLKNRKLRYLTIGMIINYIVTFYGFVRTQNMGNHQSLILVPTYIGLFSLAIIGICQMNKKSFRILGEIIIMFVLGTNFIGAITNCKYFYNNQLYTSISLKPTKRLDYENIGEMVKFIKDNCDKDDIVYINAAGSYCAQTFSSYIHPDLSLSKICVYESSIDGAHGFPVNYISQAKYIFTTNVWIESTGAKRGHIIPAINEALNTNSNIKNKFKLIKEFKMTDKVTFYAYERVEKFDKEEAEYWKEVFKKQTEEYPDKFGNRIDKYLNQMRNIEK